jgi:hypothetical protein
MQATEPAFLVRDRFFVICTVNGGQSTGKHLRQSRIPPPSGRLGALKPPAGIAQKDSRENLKKISRSANAPLHAGFFIPGYWERHGFGSDDFRAHG